MDPRASPDVPEIAPEALRQRLDRGDPTALLDVREDFERAFCRIAAPGVAADLHVPLAAVPEYLDAIRTAAAGRELVVYCHHGIRSAMAARWLAARGVGPALNLAGGIDAWSSRVDPTVPRYG